MAKAEYEAAQKCIEDETKLIEIVEKNSHNQVLKVMQKKASIKFQEQLKIQNRSNMRVMLRKKFDYCANYQA